MTCGNAKELIAASWTGDLDVAAAAQLNQHVSVCAECASEMAQLGALWQRLGDIPAPEPSLALNMRWESTLESLISARRHPQWRFSLAALWPQRPVWQVSIAVACLAIGVAVGLSIRGAGSSSHSEIAQLREEVANTKQLVALSLLQQQSASERLRGVDYTSRMPAMEPGVISALVQAVQTDPNVNVRLAAIDALTKVSGDAGVRRSLAGSLAAQDSPMVQAALIDYAVESRDRSAVDVLKVFQAREDLNPLVKQRADQAVRQLTEFK
jgi:hypothetical protein